MTDGDLPWERPLGAFPRDGGRVDVRAWAPAAGAVAVRIGGEDHPLHDAGMGVWEGRVPGEAGDDYLLVLDGGAWPDPMSRCQPLGVRGPSRVVDTGAFTWGDHGWPGLRLEDLVIYELHVGTFTHEGTFGAVVPHLPALRDLGVTAIELMPVATFPGRRNWGYDGLQISAPHEAYGGPEGLARLIDAAHAADLGVILDVVHNHLGPGSEALTAFGPYLTDRVSTPWGAAVNVDGPDSGAVREWAIQNAVMWVSEYRADGLRLDALHAIHDEGARHLVAELRDRVGSAAPRAIVIGEADMNDPRTITATDRGGWGLDAVWADDFHHALHALLTGEDEGYYADFGRVEDLAHAIRAPFVYAGRYSAHRRRRHGAPAGHVPRRRFVICSQNHDQVGNRAAGDRPPAASLRLAAFCTLLTPGTPLLFMGEEEGARTPFLFFTDHVDPFIADATREGRRREFAHLAAFAGEVPDPQDEGTFLRSVLDRDAGDPAMRGLYRDLLRLRRELLADMPDEPAVSFDEDGRWLRVELGAVELLMNLSDQPVALADARGEVVLATHPVTVEGGWALMPPWSGAALR